MVTTSTGSPIFELNELASVYLEELNYLKNFTGFLLDIFKIVTYLRTKKASLKLLMKWTSFNITQDTILSFSKGMDILPVRRKSNTQPVLIQSESLVSKNKNK